MTPLAFAATLFVLTTTGVVGALIFAVGRVGASAAQRRRNTVVAAVTLLIWLAVTAVLAARGMLSDFTSMPPRLTPVLFGANAAALVLVLSPFGKRLVLATPLAWLLGIQVFRVGVELTLALLFHAGIVPLQMTFEGRNWDILVGLSALPMAWLAAQGRLPPAALALWNVAGLGLLLNIVVISLLSLPTPLRAFPDGPANTIIASAPYVWLPALLVPVAFAGHLLVFRWLLAQPRLAGVAKHQAL